MRETLLALLLIPGPLFLAYHIVRLSISAWKFWNENAGEGGQ
jgi:hypothetical protein